MSTKRKLRVLTYRLHRQSGQAIITLTDALKGRRKEHLLGKYGTDKSQRQYKYGIGKGGTQAASARCRRPQGRTHLNHLYFIYSLDFAQGVAVTIFCGVAYLITAKSHNGEES